MALLYKLRCEIAELETKIEKLSTRDVLPNDGTGKTIAANIGTKRVYLTTVEYPDGRLGKVMVRIGKEGEKDSLYGALFHAMSRSLQWGVPLSEFIDVFKGHSVDEEGGATSDPDIPICKSFLDWAVKRLELDYLSK